MNKMSDSLCTDDLELKRLQFLWAAGSIYATKQPQLSRHFVSKFASLKEKPSLKDVGAEVKHEYCPHCHNILSPDNHSVKFKSKPSQSDQIRKLQKRAEQQALLSNKERKMLRQWVNATNKMSILCKVCHKQSRYPGGKRQLTCTAALRAYHPTANVTESRGTQKQSPGTPVVHNRSWTSTTPESSRSWNNSPIASTPYSTPSSSRIGRTPPSGTPLTGSSGRNSKKSKRDKHQQLQKMLASAKKEKDNATKSPLSAFLKSL
ncbi:UPF0711 protein C18orf21 homolog [Amphiura filiformis]|uniref:UPF0711 protein C18orf21 homolog n=1 Tax=Amphiura filiformis TaxID=82378 RepID=UPI003B2101C8